MAVIPFVRKPRRRVIGYLPMPDGTVLRFTGRTARDVVQQWQKAQWGGISRRGQEKLGYVLPCPATQSKVPTFLPGTARRGEAWFGAARRGKARHGLAWLGKAIQSKELNNVDPCDD